MPLDCGEYNGTERRKHCEMVVGVTQRLDDFIETTKEYRARTDKSLADISITLMSLGAKLEEHNRINKALGWGTTVVIGAFLIALVQWVIDFFKNKITWN